MMQIIHEQASSFKKQNLKKIQKSNITLRYQKRNLVQILVLYVKKINQVRFQYIYDAFQRSEFQKFSLKNESDTGIFYRTCDHAFKALGSAFEFYKEKKKSTVNL